LVLVLVLVVGGGALVATAVRDGLSRHTVAAPKAAATGPSAHPPSGNKTRAGGKSAHTPPRTSVGSSAAAAASVANTVGSMLHSIGSSTTPPSVAGQASKAGRELLQAAVQPKLLKPSENAIVQPFVAQLEALQSQYVGQLSGLYSQAKADYRAGKGSKLMIEAKYLPQFGSLEDSAQDQVNSILFALRAQLQAHGYPTTEMNVLRGDFYGAVNAEIAQLHG